ncbi:hypothetical protein CDAR_54321 [Caerostris darwini]|uniref:Uncharacterized protein n=1 Tax=Caerostris darwini TaxID=1538125 RepID=A0AAV4PKR0_9ARAC|nr:hypothetical protein CDAR_54321 [Caerostris darwini]
MTSERHELSVVAFMQDGATPHFARDVKTFLLNIFTKDQVISRYCKFMSPSRSPDLAQKIATLVELKDAIRKMVTCYTQL